jgi:3-deoxy-manno-octulosonate cytidylyltransferase (CMP-KDO synthetase)
MSPKILVCIPARYNSTRLLGKPLLQINNKSIIRHVYEVAGKIEYDKEIVILTDDIRIKNEVDSFSDNKCHIIEEECLNGTERIIKYLKKTPNDFEIIINLQGDEPFIDLGNINKAIYNFITKKKTQDKLVCSTIHFSTFNTIDIMNNSRVKLVTDKDNNIMYASRNSIPSGKHHKINEKITYKIHIGLFVFDKDYLINKFYLENTQYQLCEDIEWLKIIEQGYKINTIQIKNHEIGVDTLGDYLFLKKKYEF